MSTSVETNAIHSREVGALLQTAPSNPNSGMQREPITKYRPFPQVPLKDRTWPDKTINRAPIWCSVDLRDGNQALAEPMSVSEKLEMFQTLVEVGFKEIEIGFPSASQIEFDFCRQLIEENLIPDDVTVQVLVQAREELIRRSFEALKGAKQAIIHLYNSTNPAQRRIVFGMSREQIKGLAVNGTKLIRELAAANPETEWKFQYSPESFVLTELEFSLEICEAVSDVWEPTPERKIILNLPTTVETCTPNVHADQIEWFCRNLKRREASIISLHTHNDRGTGVATTELALLAGAERVEGTLFGNGERTGNLDVVTVALNMYTQGVDPKLDFSDLPRIREIYERCTRMTVPERQPYAGDLVFTAFSGSHQDAISKGFAKQDPTPGAYWEVPYLPIDPKDLGRSYEAIIRYNPQSGKGGMAFLLEQNYGFNLPKEMRVEFAKITQKVVDVQGGELKAEQIYEVFEKEYLARTEPFALEFFRSVENGNDGGPQVHCNAKLRINGEVRELQGHGNGPIDAFVEALREAGIAEIDVKSYSEHSLGAGAEAKAASYIEAQIGNRRLFGAGVDTSIDKASIKAVISALNRAA
jgi:2-isopropylmalate synthase